MMEYEEPQEQPADFGAIVKADLEFPDLQQERKSPELIAKRVAPILFEIAARSCFHHMTSRNIMDRNLGQKQLHTLLPFMMPKLSEVHVKAEGDVAEGIEAHIAKALGRDIGK